MPRAKTALPGFRVLDQPAYQQARKDAENLGDCHDHLIASAQRLNHGNVGFTIHGTGLLSEKLFHEPCDAVDYEHQTKRAEQVAEDPLLPGNRTRFDTGIHDGLLKQSMMQQCDGLHSVSLLLFFYRWNRCTQF